MLGTSFSWKLSRGASITLAILVTLFSIAFAIYISVLDEPAKAAVPTHTFGQTPINEPYSVGWMHLNNCSVTYSGHSGYSTPPGTGAEAFYLFKNQAKSSNVYGLYRKAARVGTELYDVKVYWWSDQAQYTVSAGQASIGTLTPGHLYGEFHFYEAGTNKEVSFSGMSYVNYLQKQNQVRINNAVGYWFADPTAMTLQSNNYLKNVAQITPSSYSDPRCCAWVAFDSSPSNPLVITYYNGSVGHNTAIYGNGFDISYKIAPTSDYAANQAVNTVKITENGSYTVIDVHEDVFGYAFSGWYSDAACTKKVTYYTMVSANMTLYGKYTKLYGTINIASVPECDIGSGLAGAVYEVFADASCASSPIATLTTDKNGRTNNTEKLPYGTYYIRLANPPAGYDHDPTIRSILLNASSATHEAPLSPVRYPLIYDLSGGTSTSIPTTIEQAEEDRSKNFFIPTQTATLTSSVPTRESCTFLGWGESSQPVASDQSSYDAVASQTVSSIIMPASIKTLYALWAKNPIVTFEDGFGNIVAQEEIAPGSSATPPSLSRVGYTLEGWDGQCENIYEDIVVTAVFSPNVYTIRYDANAEDASGTTIDQNATYNKPVITSANSFERHDHLFLSWNSSPDGTGDKYLPGEEMINLTAEPDDIIVLYAQWDQSIEMPATGSTALLISVLLVVLVPILSAAAAWGCLRISIR